MNQPNKTPTTDPVEDRRTTNADIADDRMLRSTLAHYVAMNCIPVGKYDQISEDCLDTLVNLLSDTVRDTARKFILGQLEHGGRLQDRDCLVEAIKECIDQNVYLRIALEQRQQSTHNK